MKNYQKIINQFKNKKTGVFIDDANLFYAQREVGWKISWKKLKKFLADQFNLQFVNYYLGEPISYKEKVKQKEFIEALAKLNFRIKTKPLKKIWLNKTEFIYKCNFDVEIAFDIARNIDKVELVIVMSGDSDFVEAKNFCLENRVNYLTICFEHNVAWEIRKIYHLFLEEIKEKIIKNPDDNRGGQTS